MFPYKQNLMPLLPLSFVGKASRPLNPREEQKGVTAKKNTPPPNKGRDIPFLQNWGGFIQ